MQQNGDTVAGKKIEIILKDDAALPDNTKRLAQELIVNDKVNLIAGFGVTPAALAAASRASRPSVGSLSALSMMGIYAPQLTAAAGDGAAEIGSAGRPARLM